MNSKLIRLPLLASVACATVVSFAAPQGVLVTDLTALRAALADPEVAEIDIPADTTIELDGTPLVVQWPQTLKGADRATSVIDGMLLSTCIKADVAATISTLTVRNGRGGVASGSVYCGGGIYSVAGGVTVSNCLVTGCGITAPAEKKSPNGGGIYLGGTIRNRVVDTAVERCFIDYPFKTGDGTLMMAGGGVHLSATDLENVKISCCTNTKAYTSGSSFTGGGGWLDGCTLVGCEISENFSDASGSAGLFVSDNAAVLTNCVLRNNVTTGSYGGLRAKASVEFYGCSILTNGAKAYCGVSAGSSCKMRNCLVQGNAATAQPGSMNCPGEFVDCIFRDNKSTNQRGGFYVSGSPNIQVRRCVFSGNTGDINFDLNTASTAESVIESCIFTNPKDSFSMCVSRPQNAVTGGYKVRNCFFSLGTTASINGAISIDDKKDHLRECPIEIENCTFAGKYSRGALYLGQASTYGATAYTNVHVRNCAFPLGDTVLFYTNASYLPFSKTIVSNMTHCAFRDDQATAQSGAWADLALPASSNVFYSVADMAFSDAASGSYGLTRNSPLRQKGEVRGWMDKKTLALGDGTYTVEKVMDYGVKPVFGGVSRRLYSGAVDIGCAQYWCAPGLMLLLR